MSAVIPLAGTVRVADYTSLVDQLDGARAWNIVDDLAADRFEGRRAGTRGADLASRYIADYFGDIGLEEAGEGETYLTRLTLPLWQLAGLPSLTLVSTGGVIVQDFGYRRDFSVIPGSGGADYSAEVVFVGYGVTAEGPGYDDYAKISAKGKIALAMVGTPPSERFVESDYGTAYMKAENALRHGALGLLLVDNPTEQTPHYIERWRCGACWTIYRALTVLGGTIEMADTLLKNGHLTLSSVQQGINQEMTPHSLDLGVQLHVSVTVNFTQNAAAYDVLGFIPGSDMGASKKAVVIGAHYDHWGKDADRSVFRGANDDASGVAVMMEIARVFAAHTKPKWPVLFAAWSGEEEGFYGAYAYVNRPYFPLKETIAYLNLDMVGYGQQLTAEVSKAHSMLRGVVTESSQELEISLGVLDYSGGSDVVPFEEKRVQNVMLIYWPDEVYHTPQDTADHVSKTNLVETARLTALMAARLSEVTILTTTETPASRPAWRVPLQSLVIVVCVGVAGAAVLVYQIRKKHKAITATQTMMPEQR